MSIEKEEIGRYVRRDVAWVDGNTSLREAIIRMAARDFDAVLVREKGGVAGIITDTDILNHIAAGKDLDKVKAREFMSKCELKGTSPCSQLSEDETVANAIKVMAGSARRNSRPPTKRSKPRLIRRGSPSITGSRRPITGIPPSTSGSARINAIE